MVAENSLETLLQFVEDHPYTGSAEQIITLSQGISETCKRLPPSALAVFREKTGINAKVFSKLKVIGEKISLFNEKERRDIVKNLPSSYGTIHALCALKPEELLMAAKSGSITSSLSIRAANAYVKQARFPQLTTTEEAKERIEGKAEQIFSIMRAIDIVLSGEEHLAVEKELRAICREYGLDLRNADCASLLTLKKQARAKAEQVWRGVLEQRLTEQWFEKTPEKLRKQFKLTSVTDLINAPLRSFTGFLQRGDGGKANFWKQHGENYVAKVQLEKEKTEDSAQRYNLKRRLEEVLKEQQELSIWTKNIIKTQGFS
ncbi:MAG: hypothetical protein AB8A71_04160 [Prochlorococcus sp.]